MVINHIDTRLLEGLIHEPAPALNPRPQSHV
jgi:hypothetical protein